LISRLPPLPDTVISLDALHATEQTMAQIPEQTGAHYLIQVKANCEHLRQQVAQACEHFAIAKLGFTTCDKAHGRIEQRRLTVAPLNPVSTGKPHTWCAMRVERHREQRRAGQSHNASDSCAYYVGSFNPWRYSREQIAALIRGHWGIENALHHRKDRSMDEDRNTARFSGCAKVTVALRSITALLCDRGSESTRTLQTRLRGTPHTAIALLHTKSLTAWENHDQPSRRRAAGPAP